ncbi:oxidoreductase [Rhodococcus fascians]|nr:oxidoreductase [Rhodococcus fascians]MBY4239164.1 oxidoreductase [Rhodococcus fascians]MBY4255081.1 oxidoreductase [Rhodococcus fascians]MBY4270515.1 oxidoreductase [Rhodococcus fascians]
MTKRTLRSRLDSMARKVDSFRVGRTIPQNLYGRDEPDQTVSLVTDALDKWFALLDNGEYDASFAAPPVARTRELTLVSRDVLCIDEQVVQLTFAAADGSAQPPWAPGMHLDFYLPSGRRRQYSLCGLPSDDTYSIAVRLVPDGGGGSPEMHALTVGTAVSIRGPRNGFPFVPSEQAVFVAGGIGITAIISMVRRARDLGMDWHLVYCGRSRESMPFLDEIEGWDPARVTVRTDDVDGMPSSMDLLGSTAPGGSVYVCGPPPMIDLVRASFDALPATHLHFERFSPPPVKNGTEFEVQLVDSGEILSVGAEETALHAIRRIRPDVAYSCQQGFCGTCRVRVLSGTPQHRENRLTTEEQRHEMLICVSRSDGERIVLDL